MVHSVCLTAQIIEAGISVNTEAYRANYVALTYGKSREYLLEECFPADVIIPADAEHLADKSDPLFPGHCL